MTLRLVSAPAADDARLFRRAGAGDPTAVAELYDCHAAIALGVAHRLLGDDALAQQAVETAFLRLCRGVGAQEVEQMSARDRIVALVQCAACELDRSRATAALREIARRLRAGEPDSPAVLRRRPAA